MAGEQAEQQPGAGAGVAEIEDPSASASPPMPTPWTADAIAVPFELDAQGTKASGGREHVGAFEQFR